MQDTEKVTIQDACCRGGKQRLQTEECCGQAWCNPEPESMHMQENDQDLEKKIEQLTRELDSCKQVQEDWKEKCMRVTADFENFKKRLVKEQAQWAETAQIQVLKELLPVVDDFDRAYEEAQKKEQTPELQAWLSGFTLIHTALQKLLQKFGVSEITNYTDFNPLYHEAIVQVESADHKPEQIVQVFQKGYQYKDQVLRPARVSVAK
jgi:molecular chaperone GrpE